LKSNISHHLQEWYREKVEADDSAKAAREEARQAREEIMRSELDGVKLTTALSLVNSILSVPPSQPEAPPGCISYSFFARLLKRELPQLKFPRVGRFTVCDK